VSDQPGLSVLFFPLFLVYCPAYFSSFFSFLHKEHAHVHRALSRTRSCSSNIHQLHARVFHLTRPCSFFLFPFYFPPPLVFFILFLPHRPLHGPQTTTHQRWILFLIFHSPSTSSV